MSPAPQQCRDGSYVSRYLDAGLRMGGSAAQKEGGAQATPQQECVVQWSADGGQSSRELVRQQYIFRPPGTTREVEDYGLALDGVMHVVLRIVPDITGGAQPALGHAPRMLRAH